MTKEVCGCKPPYRLFAFPSKKLNFDKRERWRKAMRRVKADNKHWEPTPSDRVCSDHFEGTFEGEYGWPTETHPDPSRNLGYEPKITTSRRAIFKHPAPKKSRKVSTSDMDLLSPPPSPFDDKAPSTSTQPPPTANDVIMDDPKEDCSSCFKKDELIKSYESKIDRLTRQLNYLRSTNKKLSETSKPFSHNDIKTDEKMRFYTGIESILLFQTLFKLLEPFVSTITY